MAMRMSDELFTALKAAIEAMPHRADPKRKAIVLATYENIMEARHMRYRWDTLYASKFPVHTLYHAGLNDQHIDTALRAIMGDTYDAP